MALVPESDGKIECLRRRQRECGSFEDLLEPEAGCLVYRLRLSRSGHSQDTGTPNTPVLLRVTTATRDVLRAGLVCSGAQEDHCTEVPARRPTQNTPANSTHYRNRQNLERTPELFICDAGGSGQLNLEDHAQFSSRSSCNPDVYRLRSRHPFDCCLHAPFMQPVSAQVDRKFWLPFGEPAAAGQEEAPASRGSQDGLSPRNGHAADLANAERNDRKPARISSVRSFGCSNAAKCPPLVSRL